MPRTCTICTHTERAAIDRELVTGDAYRHIASRYGVSTTALQRHKADHLPPALAQAKQAEAVADADDLLRQVAALRSKALSLLLKAEQAGDFRTALAGIREARGCVELLARMVGELQDTATVNIVTPAWLDVRRALMDALRPHPEARIAVADRLAAIEAGHDDGP